jgi:hypothetical protein
MKVRRLGWAGHLALMKGIIISYTVSRFLRFNSGEYLELYLLDCNTVYAGSWFLTVRGNLLPPLPHFQALFAGSMLLRTVDNYIPDYTVSKLRNPCTVLWDTSWRAVTCKTV